jgi:hypothetical protein
MKNHKNEIIQPLFDSTEIIRYQLLITNIELEVWTNVLRNTVTNIEENLRGNVSDKNKKPLENQLESSYKVLETI